MTSPVSAPPPPHTGITANRGAWITNIISGLSLLVSALAFFWSINGPEYMHSWNDPSSTMTIGEFGKKPGVDSYTFTGENLSAPIEGSAKNIPRDNELWLVVRPLPDSPWYPVKQVVPQSDGGWTVPKEQVSLMPAGDFEIFMFVATSRAASSFRTYLKATEGKSGTPGMEVLPPETTFLVSRRVVRQS